VSQLLLGGVHLEPVPSQSDYTTAMAQNLRAYLLSQFMAKTGVTLLVDNLVDSYNAPDVNDGNGKCRRLVLSEGAGTPITAATSDKPSRPPRLVLASTSMMSSITHWIATAQARTSAASTSLPSWTLRTHPCFRSVCSAYLSSRRTFQWSCLSRVCRSSV
jgi:hypothetical protein